MATEVRSVSILVCETFQQRASAPSHSLSALDPSASSLDPAAPSALLCQHQARLLQAELHRLSCAYARSSAPPHRHHGTDAPIYCCYLLVIRISMRSVACPALPVCIDSCARSSCGIHVFLRCSFRSRACSAANDSLCVPVCNPASPRKQTMFRNGDVESQVDVSKDSRAGHSDIDDVSSCMTELMRCSLEFRIFRRFVANPSCHYRHQLSRNSDTVWRIWANESERQPDRIFASTTAERLWLQIFLLA